MKKMKLSEAILKGCQQSTKCKMVYFLPDERRTCALGAAYIATFGWPKVERCGTNNRLRSHYPILKQKINGKFIDDIIADRNDFGKWSRERIAQWVAKLEKKLEAK